VSLPRRLPAADAEALVSALRTAGAEADAAPVAEPPSPCPAHPTFDAADLCDTCGALLCVLCVARGGPARQCDACAGRVRRSRRFYRARVTVLLVILAGVLLYAWKDVHRRHARNDWRRTLSVGLVVVKVGPVDAGALRALRERAHALEDVLAAEARRVRGPGGPRPIDVEVLGPVEAATRPPMPEGDGVMDLVRYTWAKSRYAARIDEAVGPDVRGLDARIYLVARPPDGSGTNFVEGLSEQGGRAGFVEVNLDETMVDFALFVFAHELCHTLGATDKYDASGSTMIPEGLAEPDAVPRFPQRFAEVMARARVIGPGQEQAPGSLSELRVGPITAREIGWVGEAR
jgi:hypothetical protein